VKKNRPREVGQTWVTKDSLYLFSALVNFFAAVLRYFSGP
jgi:hypothetical protein